MAGRCSGGGGGTDTTSVLSKRAAATAALARWSIGVGDLGFVIGFDCGGSDCSRKSRCMREDDAIVWGCARVARRRSGEAARRQGGKEARRQGGEEARRQGAKVGDDSLVLAFWLFWLSGACAFGFAEVRRLLFGFGGSAHDESL